MDLFDNLEDTAGRTIVGGDGGASLSSRRNGAANKLDAADRCVHDWYRFVLSFPPHLVRDTLRRFNIRPDQQVLDPFCGTGTTLVECKKLGIPAIGVEANPMAFFASQVKLDWTPSPGELLSHAGRVSEAVLDELDIAGIPDHPSLEPLVTIPAGTSLRSLAPDLQALLLTDSISPLPLHKALVLRDTIERLHDDRFSRHETLAFAKALVSEISNLHFGPEVGVRSPKTDAPVILSWMSGVRAMARDLEEIQGAGPHPPCKVHHADSRDLADLLEPQSVDMVITSPPYPNEKDYTRTTRLESVLLGFIRSKQELQDLKRTLVRSNTRSTYKEDDDDRWIAGHPEIQQIADAIEARRVELGKTSGFERMYPRVTKLYFGGMARHLSDLRRILRPGAHLAYVVGDQASYLRVMIRTGELLARIAQGLGYKLVGIDLFRTRLATATREQLREEVLVLQWPG